MSDQYLGEIRMVGFNFAPVGWALCNGQLLPVNQYSALFSLLGTTYGGNGSQTFGLPDLQGRFPLHAGAGAGLPVYNQGQKAGVSAITLLSPNLPPHTHMVTPAVSTAVAQSGSPVGTYPAVQSITVVPTPGRGDGSTPFGYNTTAQGTGGAYQSGVSGTGVPISIQPPYLAVYFIIALQGIFPSRP